MHRGTLQGDVEWYRRKAVESGGPVLELGAGTGRVTIPIAEAGIRVSAVDLDAGMLDKLRQKAATLPDEARSRVTVHQGDMRSFALDEQFALVIIPFRAFLHNLTRDDQLATLRRAHAHLRPGGELALNVFHPSLEYMAANAGAYAGVWRWRKTVTLPDGRLRRLFRGQSLQHGSAAPRVDDSHGRIRGRWVLAADQHDASRARVPLPVRHRSLLEESGFEPPRISGDFRGRAFERDGDELVVEARKPMSDSRPYA